VVSGIICFYGTDTSTSEWVENIRFVPNLVACFQVDVFLAGPGTTANELYGDKIIDPLKPLRVLPDVADGS
jgi:hypothetical protein